MPNWTTTSLPLPDNNPSSTTGVDVARTDMDSGRRRSRVRGDTQIKFYDVQWQFTGAEYATFEAFFATDLVNGTAYFDMKLPIAGTLTDVSVRFVDSTYRESYRDFDTHIVNAQLEREIVQTVADPSTDPAPLWYRPTYQIYGDTTLTTLYLDADLIVNTNEGETIILTVPDYFTLEDLLRVGISNKGLGGVLVVAANGDAGLTSTIALPVYMSASTDAYITGGLSGTPDWTTSGADADDGNVTSWPSLKGGYAALVPANTAALKSNNATPRHVPLEAAWTVADAPATTTTTTAVLFMYRNTLSNTFRRLCEGSNYRLYIGGSDGSTTIILEPVVSGAAVATWTAPVASPSAAVAGGSLVNDRWLAIGLLWNEDAASMRIFINGTELTLASGGSPASMGTFNKFGATSLPAYAVGRLGDICFYEGTDATSMEAFTLEAYNRWNTPPGLGESTALDILAGLGGAKVLFDATLSRICTDTAGSTVATDNQAMRYLENLVGTGLHMTSTIDSGAYRSAGYIETTAAKPAKTMNTPDLGALPNGCVIACIYRIPVANSGNRSMRIGSTGWTGLTSEITGASSPFDQNKLIGATTAGTRKLAFTSGTTDWHYFVLVKNETTLEVRVDGTKLGNYSDAAIIAATNSYFTPFFTDYPFAGQIRTLFASNDYTVAGQMELALASITDALNA